MTSCTLLWKELSDHFSSLEQDLLNQSEALKNKILTLDHHLLQRRETTIDDSVQIALRNLDHRRDAALSSLTEDSHDSPVDGEIDNGDGVMLKLKSFCLRMGALGFWGFVIGKKELECLRDEMSAALSECVDPVRFVLEAMSEEAIDGHCLKLL